MLRNDLRFIRETVGVNSKIQLKMGVEDLDEFMNSEAYKKQEALLKEKEKTLKQGPNVIHLDYYAPIITNEEILEVEKNLKQQGIELSHYDKNGVIYASLQDFQLDIFIAIAQPIIGDLMSGIGSNAIWDLIKSSLIYLRSKVLERSTNIIKDSTKDRIKFGLQTRLDKNTSFNFELDSSLDNSEAIVALDKIFYFLRERELNKKFKITDYVYYDSDSNKWISTDVEEEFKKQIRSRKGKGSP